MEKQTETSGISTGAMVTVFAVLLVAVAVMWAFFTDSNPLSMFQ